MRHWNLWGVCGVLLAVSGCHDAGNPTGPEEGRLKWGWDEPLGTGTPSPPSMSCTQPSAFLGTATCTAAGIPPTGNPSWSFETAAGVVIAGPSSTLSWSGSMVASGTATVTYTDANGQQQTLSYGVSVPRRAVSWASVVGGSTGQPGDIDVCIQENWDGLTASKLCTSSSDAAQFFIPRVAELSSSNGLSVAQVGSTGPNAGLFYVNQMSAYMDLRTQISPRYRTNGPAYTLAFAPTTLVSACAAASVYGSASVYQANAVCTGNIVPFNNLVSCIWSHEARHMTAGVGAAKYVNNDVYALWEPLARSTSTALVTAAKEEYDFAHLRVRGIIDAAQNTGPYTNFSGRWMTGSGWAQSYYQWC